MADTDKEADDFATNLTNFVSGGFICMAIALGNNVGLFDILKDLEEPVDCQTLADRADLRERYVREWLGSMVAAKIIYMDGESKYYIPDKCKKSLDMAVYAPVLPLLAQRQKTIEALFKKSTNNEGKDVYGVDFGPEYFAWQDKEWQHCEEHRIDQAILPALARYKNKDNISNILDVGCGGGILVTGLAKRLPNAFVIGIDNSEVALQRAKTYVKEKNVPNTEFIRHDVASLPAEWENRFDFIILFDVLHDLPDPELSIKEIKRVLKEDGVLMCVDPKISSYPHKNIGDINASFCLAYSTYSCLPHSLHSGGAAGLGAGWGMEKEEEFLKSHLNVAEISEFSSNECSNNFVCLKK